MGRDRHRAEQMPAMGEATAVLDAPPPAETPTETTLPAMGEVQAAPPAHKPLVLGSRVFFYEREAGRLKPRVADVVERDPFGKWVLNVHLPIGRLYPVREMTDARYCGPTPADQSWCWPEDAPQ